MTNKTPKGVFLDRDGTLFRDKNYLQDPADIEYFPDTFDALRLLRDKGYALYLITNQSGVGRGFFPIQSVQAVHRALESDMLARGLPRFRGIGVCPHAPHQECLCRKPLPHMVKEFLLRDRLEPKLCWMVGDKTIDAACGANAGINGAVVRERAHAGTYPFHPTLMDFAKSLPLE